MDVDGSIKKYQQSHPDAGRTELFTMVRQGYEIEGLKHGTLNEREEKTFLKKLERRLKQLFPEPTKQKKLEEEKIMQVLQEHYPNGVMGRLPLDPQVKYQPTVNEAEEVVKNCGARTWNVLDEKFRKKVARLKKKWLAEASLASRASK